MQSAIYIYVGIGILLAIVFMLYNKQKAHKKEPVSETRAAIKRKNADGITIILCGLSVIGLFAFLGLTNSESSRGSLLAAYIVGTLICLWGIGCVFFNRNAYLSIEHGRIKGKYHWFGKIDCSISEVVFALGQINTLTIQLSNSKRHTIMGIENSRQLSALIRRNMPFVVTEHPQKLLAELNNLKSARKKTIVYVCIGTALMFVNIFIAVFLTGARDMDAFSKRDWVIFSVIGAIEMATVVATFYFADKGGKYMIPLEKQKYVIQRTIIETTPPLSPNAIKLLTDEDYTFRVTVFANANEDYIYYAVQELNSEFQLIKTLESDIFEDISKLPKSFNNLIDITKIVLRKGID